VWNSLINIDRVHVFNEMNLLVAVDDISVAGIVRKSVTGIATDIISNATKPSPPKSTERQLQFIGDNHAPSRLLQMIAILYCRTYKTIYRWLESLSESSFRRDEGGGDVGGRDDGWGDEGGGGGGITRR
jgi:hypothetical protein